MLRETKPGRKANIWVWSSRLGKYHLPKIVSCVVENLESSLFVDSSRKLKPGAWRSALKVLAPGKAQEIAVNIVSPKGRYKGLCIDDSAGLERYFLASRQGLAWVCSPECNRKSARRLFWKILQVTELAIFKHRIYQDYAGFLRAQTRRLKDLKLGALRCTRPGDLFKYPRYTKVVPHFLLALDEYIKGVKPIYRRMYSDISDAVDLDRYRDVVMQLAKEWEQELDKRHPLRKMLLEVVSLLKLVK